MSDGAVNQDTVQAAETVEGHAAEPGADDWESGLAPKVKAAIDELLPGMSCSRDLVAQQKMVIPNCDAQTKMRAKRPRLISNQPQ